MLHWTTDLTLWLITFNLALGASEFLAACRALGRLAYGFANLITYWLVTFPLTFRVTVVSLAAVSTGIRASAVFSSNVYGRRKGEKTEKGNDGKSSHDDCF